MGNSIGGSAFFFGASIVSLVNFCEECGVLKERGGFDG